MLPAAESMDQLRTEIIEAQKARADLLKWKLVIVAALGGVGLGFSTSQMPLPLILVLVPLVCIYVDLLCHHLNLRIELIAQFMRGDPDVPVTEADGIVMQSYESYVRRMSGKEKDVFRLENWALLYSTLFLSLTVAAFGAWRAVVEHQFTTVAVALVVSGLTGCLLSYVIDRLYRNRRDRIDRSRVKPLREQALS